MQSAVKTDKTVNMKMLFMWLIVLFCIKGMPVLGDLRCIPRQGDPGQGHVCVCNSTYCDTIERPTPLPRGHYHWYTTSNSTPGFSHNNGLFLLVSVSSADVIFKINTSVQFQEIIGFGASFTDTSGIHLTSLPAGAQDNMVESYFGKSGIEYNLGRLPIGGTDFSPRPYTLDDVPFDEDLQHFNLTEEDHNYKIPFIKKAMSVSERGMKLMGCTWMAPAWMKDDDNNHSGYVRAKYLHTWAQYHIKFLEAYQKEGIDIWALSGGNEVMLTMILPVALNSLNSTLVTAPIQRHWLKEHLKPLLLASNFSNVKFVALDDARVFAPYWLSRFAEDPEAYQYLDGVALHWYFDWFTPPSILTGLHQDFPDKLILYTESSINFVPINKYLGPWVVAAAYSYNIMQNLNHWTQSYMDWNLAVDHEGGPSLGLDVAGAVVVNKTSGEFYKQPVFYALGHFSKFIPPGSRIVQVESNQNKTLRTDFKFMPKMKHPEENAELYSSAKDSPPPDPWQFLPSVVECLATANSDGSYTIIVHSTRNETTPVSIEVPDRGYIEVDIEAFSINTFVYWL